MQSVPIASPTMLPIAGTCNILPWSRQTRRYVWIVSVGEHGEGSSVKHVYDNAASAEAKRCEIEQTLLSCDYVNVEQFVIES